MADLLSSERAVASAWQARPVCAKACAGTPPPSWPRGRQQFQPHTRRERRSGVFLAGSRDGR
eukprot:6185293-Pleurochrysis_carterae.AAC.1